MKRIYSLMLLLSATITAANACDVCGCSASNQYLGILPQNQVNFIGFQYQYGRFSSVHPSLFENRPDDHSQDDYQTFQLWGRYQVGKRLQVFAFVPYRYNNHEEDSVHSTNSGLGDISALINYTVIREAPGDQSWKQQLFAGGGLKMPTGHNTGITDLDRQGLPNMQPGTGSWDFIANANYTLQYKRAGINLDAAYTMTTANKDNYKYGNRFNSGLMAFYSLHTRDKKVTVLPQAGIRYEYTLHDYDNFSRKWLNDQSGGYLCYASVGAQAYYKQLGLRLTWQLPVGQYYGAGYVTAGQKLDAGVFFLFK